MGADSIVGMLRLDSSWSVIAADAAFRRLYGCDDAAVVGRAIDDLFVARDRHVRLDATVDVLVTLDVGGTERLTRLRLRAHGDGYLAFAEPVGGKEDLLYRLALVEQRWKGLFQASTDGVVILDHDGRIVEHNAVFSNLLLRPGAEVMLGRSFSDVVRSEFPTMAASLADLPEELVLRSTGHAKRMLEMRARPLLLPNRSRVGTFVLLRDVAESFQVQLRDARIRADLLRARAFQRAVLAEPSEGAAVDIDIGYRPLEEVGGDVFDVAFVGPNQLRVFVADATGHGVPAALATMLIKNTYDAVKTEASGPAEALVMLDDQIATRYKSLDVVFTAVVVDVDLATRRVRHSCGAHPPPLVASHRNVVELEPGGTFLGVLPGQKFQSFERQLADGESLFVVTDGLAEARRGPSEYFGDARLRDAIQSAGEIRHEPCDAILAQIDAWLRPSSASDDMTIVSIRPH